jgi:hypothetical protein
MQLDAWLRAHNYAIPSTTRAAIDYYVNLQFDFIILRLRPGAGIQQMQPVRITMRGYMPMLPLRMISAGIGDKVGLTLSVIAAGRVEAQGYTNAVIGDLILDGSSGPLVPVEHVAPTLLNPPACPRTSSCAVIGTTAPLALEALGIASIVMIVRRRRRAKAQ